VFNLAFYRAPIGDSAQFVSKSDCIINYLHKPRPEFIICGDINMDFLTESHHKQCPVSQLTSFSLTSTAELQTRMQNYWSTAIDNVFIDYTRKNHYSIK
jgi:exonuclease III